MKMNFTHPYRENLSINFGPFTQIVGDNQQLKYYMWQLLIWYFNGKKYNVDLPIINAVNNVVNGIVSPRVAVNSLLNREPKPEV